MPTLLTPNHLRQLAQAWVDTARASAFRPGTQRHQITEHAYWMGVENTLQLRGESLGEPRLFHLTTGKSLAHRILGAKP